MISYSENQFYSKMISSVVYICIKAVAQQAKITNLYVTHSVMEIIFEIFYL